LKWFNYCSYQWIIIISSFTSDLNDYPLILMNYSKISTSIQRFNDELLTDLQSNLNDFTIDYHYSLSE